jgi:alpha-galactosidase
MKKIVALFATLVVLVSAQAAELAPTPPMGWNSWNTFKLDINEALVHQVADVLDSSGMKAAGYQYVTLDDGWQLTTRDQAGDLQVDKQKFSAGMKAMGDYLHARGLLFGIYTSAGVKTCMRREGSYDFEEQDARLFASWGVDLVKVDWCCTHPKHLSDKTRSCPRNERQDYGDTGQEMLYKRWRAAIDKSGRPMLLSVCEWGTGKPWLWAPQIANMWRTTEDILPCRNCKKSWWGLGWQRILEQQVGLERYAGPGHWNDPDMLVVGVKGIDDLDAKAHFSFWCLLAAPLMAGNDPRSMSNETRAILTNREAIAVNQDSLGKEGWQLRTDSSTEVWVKPLVNESWAVILFNKSGRPRAIPFAFSGLAAQSRYAVRDLWTKKDLGTFDSQYEANVGAHDVAFITLKPR